MKTRIHFLEFMTNCNGNDLLQEIKTRLKILIFWYILLFEFLASKNSTSAILFSFAITCIDKNTMHTLLMAHQIDQVS